MPVETRVDIQGLDEFVRALRALKPALQKKVLPKPLRAAMMPMRATIAMNAPVLDTKKRGGRWMLENKARKKGLIRQRVRVMPSKLQRSRGNVGTWLTVYQPGASRKVKKAEGAYLRMRSRKEQEAYKASMRAGGTRRAFFRSRRAKGAVPYKTFVGPGRNYLPNDPFYFKFLERGTKNIPQGRYNFITPVVKGPGGTSTLRRAIDYSRDAIRKLKVKDVT